MTPDVAAFTIAAGTTSTVGVVGAAGISALARRSVRAASVGAPLVVVASMAAGILVSAKAMFLSEHDNSLVLMVLLATVPIALVVGVLLGREVRSIDRRAVEQAAERERTAALEASRREMIAWVSHDLRTPLAGIRAMAEALEDGLAPRPGEYHARIRTETDRMAGMVDDLLALTSLQAGTTRLDRSRVSVDDLVSDTLATVAPVAAARSVRVEGSADGPLPVRGDVRQLSRAVLNLVDNAVRHTPPGAVVRVCAELDAQPGRPATVVVTVQDACGGIPPEDLPHVFEPGWRGSAARTPGEGQGAGLGLAVVAAIVAVHDGTVGVRNAGSGCLVAMRLPAYPGPSPTPDMG